MNDRFDFEHRLHQMPHTVGALQTFWAEYRTYSAGYAYDVTNKILREFRHSYAEIANIPWRDDILADELDVLIGALSWEGQLLTQQEHAIQTAPPDVNSFFIQTESTITST